ncbi:YtxH domain-containing protein [Oceanobacillus piezotolerans]|uniref:YtxH domain-containing protein n=1 Tax=Oceanobacillus piezotolerans TaxID=2448030 RepID=A0A498D1A2_9BACI|nr:YtxH domain-containing protein [Oceanobacillus piezotolerans]RLL40365.1 YtxH domain-containing protein [Oceanobacillus piezotolerans]
MGRRRLVSGMVIGATVGSIIALLDKDTRDYAKDRLEVAKERSSYYIQHPSEAIENIRESVDRMNQTIASGADNAINALEQVEGTIEKFTNKNHQEL